MRPPVVPILTILSLLGRVVSDRRATSSSSVENSSSTSSITASSTTGSTSSSTSFEESTFTPDTSASFTNPLTSQQSSFSQEPFSTRISRASSTSTASFTFVTPSDLPSTSSTLAVSTSASTSSDSTFFTVTAVVSRPTTPTTTDGLPASTKTGFFADKGAVVGTFLVAGLFGTAFLFCAFLWVLRRCSRRRRWNNQAYLDDEYREFSHDRSGTTPEPTLPFTRDSRSATPISPSPAPNMIERLHGIDQGGQNMSYNVAQGQYRPGSGEFDPYKAHGTAYGYMNHPYHLYTEDGQQESGGYAYEPQVDVRRRVQTVAGP